MPLEEHAVRHCLAKLGLSGEIGVYVDRIIVPAQRSKADEICLGEDSPKALRLSNL